MTTIKWGSSTGTGILLPFTGNSALDGTRIVNAGAADDDIALAFNEFVPDANTLVAWRMNEASWSGELDEVVDASSNSLHGTAYNGATTATGWLNRCGAFLDADGLQHVRSDASNLLNGLNSWWMSAWAKPVQRASAYGRFGAILAVSPPGSTYRLALAVCWDTTPPTAAVATESPTFTTSTSVPTDQWTHIGFEWTAAGTLRIYVNGTVAGEWTSAVWQPTQDLHVVSGVSTPDASTIYNRYVGYADDAVLATQNPWGGEFSPHRYESGTVTAQYALGTSYRLTNVDWSATTGVDYGQITKVEVYSGGAWLTVAENANGLTPPLTGLDYTVTGPDIVRLTLVPKADTLQSETPLLDWVAVATESAGGHRRKPLLLGRHRGPGAWQYT